MIQLTDDEEIMYLLNIMTKERLAQTSRIKNRRFTAMKELLANGDYFSDEEMKQRDPLLYQQVS